MKYVTLHRNVREGSIIILAGFIDPLSWNWISFSVPKFLFQVSSNSLPRRRRYCGCLVLSVNWPFLASLLSGVTFLTFESLKRTFLFLRWLQNLLAVVCHHHHHHHHHHHLCLHHHHHLYFLTFYFHFRNSTSLGWTVFNRVIVRFNHLQCILHSRTLASGGVIRWICWWTPRNKVPFTWNL